MAKWMKHYGYDTLVLLPEDVHKVYLWAPERNGHE